VKSEGEGTMANHFYLVRHGETSWNQLRKLQGHTDIPLNENGISQAKMVAKRLSTLPIDIVCSSDLIRAKRTAEEIAKYHQGKSILEAKEFRERHYGQWEGLHWDEIQKRYPGYYDDQKNNGEHGIETIENMQTRGVSKLLELCQAYPNQHIAVVSHGGFINSLLYHFTNGEHGTGITRLVNTSYNHLSYQNGKWTVHTINDSSHLDSKNPPRGIQL